METLLKDPAFIAAIVAFITALTAFVRSHTTDNRVYDVSQRVAKTEEKINGGLDSRVKAIVEPQITQAVNSVRSSNTPPSVK